MAPKSERQFVKRFGRKYPAGNVKRFGRKSPAGNSFIRVIRCTAFNSLYCFGRKSPAGNSFIRAIRCTALL